MSKKYSIKCTKCSAPLTLLGGGRVETITCSYCKSVLDLDNDYRVLSNFRKYKGAFKLPFEIGMKGELFDIEYTIIGRVTYEELEPPFVEWSDFLLFSPFYGYAWLSYEQGHLSYSRRNRTFPNISWSEVGQHDLIRVDELAYRPYSSYTARIVYVEGELTWVAKNGDKTSFIELIAPPYGMSLEKSKDEVEQYETKYLEVESVYDAFDVSKEERVLPTIFHPLQPFKRPFLEALSKVSMWVMLIVALLFVAFMVDGKGKEVKHWMVSNNYVVDENFTLHSTEYLTNLQLRAGSNQSLKNFNIQIRKDNALVFSLSGGRAYHFGKESQIERKFSTWKRRAKSVDIFIKLKEVGAYQIKIVPVNKSLSSQIKVTLVEKEVRTNYLVYFFVLTFLGFILLLISRWRHKRELREEQSFFGSEGMSISDGNFIFDNFSTIAFMLFMIFVIMSNR